MSKLTHVTRAVLMGLAIAAGPIGFGGATAASAAQGDAPAPMETKAVKPARQCFYLSDWRGWTAPDKNTLYMKVRGRDVYRVDLSWGSNQLTWPGTHLVSIVRGSDSICNPLDLDLRVADGSGFSTPIRAKTITKLTPEQIQAIPKKYRP